MTPIEIYGHGPKFGQISRNNQQLFTMQDLGGGESLLKEGNDSRLVSYTGLIKLLRLHRRDGFASSLDCSIGAIAEQGLQNIRLLRPRNNPGCSLQELPFPVTPSTAHNRDLSRTALLRLADNLSKWFRKQCSVDGDLWSSIAPAG